MGCQLESKQPAKSSLARSAGIVSGATLISRVLGLVREQVTAYLFGASDAVDAFKSAFRIPNLLRDMFAEGALSAGFIPIFSEKLRSGSKEEAIRFAGLVFGAMTAIVAVVVLLMMMPTPPACNPDRRRIRTSPGKTRFDHYNGKIYDAIPFDGLARSIAYGHSQLTGQILRPGNCSGNDESRRLSAQLL